MKKRGIQVECVQFYKYVYWLGEQVPQEMCMEAIEALIQCSEYDVPHIIDYANAATWGNALRVLKRIGYPRNRVALLPVMKTLRTKRDENFGIAAKIIEQIYKRETRYVIDTIEKIVEGAELNAPYLHGIKELKESLMIPDNAFKSTKLNSLLGDVKYDEPKKLSAAQEEFNKYRYWLASLMPPDMQQIAANFLLHCRDEYIATIISRDNPYNYDNAIKVVNSIGYPRNRTALGGVMLLMQDVNWSTTPLAIKMIKEVYAYEPQYVIDTIETTVFRASAIHDFSWCNGLGYLKEELAIPNEKFASSHIVKLMTDGTDGDVHFSSHFD